MKRKEKKIREETREEKREKEKIEKEAKRDHNKRGWCWKKIKIYNKATTIFKRRH